MAAKQRSSTFTRRSREDRRDELLAASLKLALDGGLTSISARRVAAEVGVAQGLVSHYFRSVDELLAATFAHAAQTDQERINAQLADTPLERLRMMLALLGAHDRDPIALLWIDAWRESARRPAVQRVVVSAMERDITDLGAIIAEGKAIGAFPSAGSHSAMRILALIDGFAASAAVRAGIAGSNLDYEDVFDFVLRTAEHELGLAAGVLDPHQV